MLILRSLAVGPNHAYGISQFLTQESGQEFAVDNGSLYPAIQRLLQNPLAVAVLEGQYGEGDRIRVDRTKDGNALSFEKAREAVRAER